VPVPAGGGLQFTIDPTATLKGAYAKELSLLQRVLASAEFGNPESVCAAAESFGGAATSTDGKKAWMKLAAGVKGSLLATCATALPEGDHILEIGTYCGYSALRMCLAAPTSKLTTLEVDPVHMVIARHIIAFAGLSHRIDVRCTHSRHLLDELGESSCKYGMVFMDSRSSGYDAELSALLAGGLLRCGAVVVADNVLKPGCPGFLWHLTRSHRFDTKIVSLQEFAMTSEDWMVVSVVKELPALHSGEDVQTLSGQEPPEEVVRLQQACERMRHKTTHLEHGVDFAEWAAFSRAMKAQLAEVGITAVPLGS